MDSHLSTSTIIDPPPRAPLRVLRRSAAVALVVACLMCATGCTGAADATGGTGQRGEQVAPWGDSTTLFLTAETLGQDTSFLLRPPPPESGYSAAARIFGTVAVLPGRCLGLSPTTAVAWPNGTTVLPEGDGVKLSDGQVPRVGDTLDTGGGFANVAFTGTAGGCPGSDVAFINNPSN